MAVYWRATRPGVKPGTAGAGVWWYSFLFAGKRIQESAKTHRKTIAVEAEKNRRLELERTLAGLPAAKREGRIRSVGDVVKPYEENFGINHREKSVLFVKGRLTHIKRLLGRVLLPDLTEDAVRGYMKTRLAEGASGRTINMELGELSRSIGRTWSTLWPKVRKLEENDDVGRALSPEEESRLLSAATHSPSPMIGTFVRIALLTGMRSGEIVSLRWSQIDFAKRVLTVGKSKTAAGRGRQIPMNQDLTEVLSVHAAWFTQLFGSTLPDYCLFPFGKGRKPQDPTKPITDVSTAWHALRKRAAVQCRLHDLRHTAATKFAEAGVPESTMLALMGHMSRAMLERYSHIRMAAKRDAVEALALSKPNADAKLDSTISSTVVRAGRVQ